MIQNLILILLGYLFANQFYQNIIDKEKIIILNN